MIADLSTPENLDLVAVGIVKEVPTPHTILLEDNNTYVLDNIRVPAQYEILALDYLKKILIGKQVGVFMNPNAKGNRVDQNGNKIGQVMTADAGWVQANLISQGLAYAFSQPDSNIMIPELYKYEEEARKRNAGFWQNATYSLRDKDTIANAVGSFQVLEDVVDDVRTRGEYISLIFGKEIPAKFSALIKKDGTGGTGDLPASNLVKERIRVHGWVENNNGVIMYVTHPEQVEILNPKKAQKKTYDCSKGDAEARRACMAHRRMSYE